MILTTIASTLSQLYRIELPAPLEDFLIDKPSFESFCKTQEHLDPDCRETLLITPCKDAIEIGLYIAPEILELLAADDPAASNNIHY